MPLLVVSGSGVVWGRRRLERGLSLVIGGAPMWIIFDFYRNSDTPAF